MLALTVGVFQLLLGLLRFGLLVNFLSHPVINGFTNDAAIIIATSQLAKIFGVEEEKAEYHYEMVLRLLESARHYTHWPTFSMAALAIIMVVLKRKNSRISGFLAAVVVTTVISRVYRLKVNASPLKEDKLILSGGGSVVDKVLAVMNRSGLLEEIGAENIYGSEKAALDQIIGQIHEGTTGKPCRNCPLTIHVPIVGNSTLD